MPIKVNLCIIRKRNSIMSIVNDRAVPLRKCKLQERLLFFLLMLVNVLLLILKKIQFHMRSCYFNYRSKNNKKKQNAVGFFIYISLICEISLKIDYSI